MGFLAVFFWGLTFGMEVVALLFVALCTVMDDSGRDPAWPSEWQFLLLGWQIGLVVLALACRFYSRHYRKSGQLGKFKAKKIAFITGKCVTASIPVWFLVALFAEMKIVHALLRVIA